MWLAKDDCQLLLERGQLCLGWEGGYKGTEGCVFRYMIIRDGRVANVRVALNVCPVFWLLFVEVKLCVSFQAKCHMTICLEKCNGNNGRISMIKKTKLGWTLSHLILTKWSWLRQRSDFLLLAQEVICNGLSLSLLRGQQPCPWKLPITCLCFWKQSAALNRNG